MRKMTITPHQQFKNEHRALLNRWLEESDIEDMEMARIAMDDLNEWLGEDVLEFESEIELLDEDEETG
jgi:hypothetical protein